MVSVHCLNSFSASDSVSEDGSLLPVAWCTLTACGPDSQSLDSPRSWPRGNEGSKFLQDGSDAGRASHSAQRTHVRSCMHAHALRTCDNALTCVHACTKAAAAGALRMHREMTSRNARTTKLWWPVSDIPTTSSAQAGHGGSKPPQHQPTRPHTSSLSRQQKSTHAWKTRARFSTRPTMRPTPIVAQKKMMKKTHNDTWPALPMNCRDRFVGNC